MMCVRRCASFGFAFTKTPVSDEEMFTKKRPFWKIVPETGGEVTEWHHVNKAGLFFSFFISHAWCNLFVLHLVLLVSVLAQLQPWNVLRHKKLIRSICRFAEKIINRQHLYVIQFYFIEQTLHEQINVPVVIVPNEPLRINPATVRVVVVALMCPLPWRQVYSRT